MAPSRHDWKIVDWDVKPQHNQPTNLFWINEPVHDKINKMTCAPSDESSSAQSDQSLRFPHEEARESKLPKKAHTSLYKALRCIHKYQGISGIFLR